MNSFGAITKGRKPKHLKLCLNNSVENCLIIQKGLKTKFLRKKTS
jgi:hypothetical protein